MKRILQLLALGALAACAVQSPPVSERCDGSTSDTGCIYSLSEDIRDGL